MCNFCIKNPFHDAQNDWSKELRFYYQKYKRALFFEIKNNIFSDCRTKKNDRDYQSPWTVKWVSLNLLGLRVYGLEFKGPDFIWTLKFQP